MNDPCHEEQSADGEHRSCREGSGTVTIPARWVTSADTGPLLVERRVRVASFEYAGNMLRVQGRVEAHCPVILSLWRRVEDGTHIPAVSFEYSKTEGDFFGVLQVRKGETLAPDGLFLLVIEDEPAGDGTG